MIKVAVLSVAFYSEKFSKALIGSFRKYYPATTLMIVNNNLDETEEKSITELGLRETAFLEGRKDIIYARNSIKNRSHGIGLDIGVRHLYSLSFQVVITVDIDSLITKGGFVEMCLSAYGDGRPLGGRIHTIERGGQKTAYVHPCFAYYDLVLLNSLNLSFEDERRKDTLSTGERICYTLEGRGYVPKVFNNNKIDGVYHFGGGSILRMGEQFVKQKLIGQEKYEDKLKQFFEREDVKCHL